MKNLKPVTLIVLILIFKSVFNLNINVTFTDIILY